MRRLPLILLALVLLLAYAPITSAATIAPAQAAETVRAELVRAQLALASDPARAQSALDAARSAYAGTLAGPFGSTLPAIDERARAGFAAAQSALETADAPAFAAARASTWAALLAGGYGMVEHALAANDAASAQSWLPLREFRHATRFSRPDSDATLALAAAAAGTRPAAEALDAVRADLLDTYQARLTEAIHDLSTADAQGFATRRSEAAALADGYFAILAPAYAAQRGDAALQTAQAAFAALQRAAHDGSALAPALAPAEDALRGFRAAPLSAADQARRAGQLQRFLALVPVEYGRGVSNGQVTQDLEIREATTFRDGAAAAFADLQTALDARDPAATTRAAALFGTLEQQLAAASANKDVPDPDDVQATVDELTATLHGVMPAEWQKRDTAGDFDVISTMLDQMVAAASAGQYELAESARLESYAVLESGPEARLVVFAPQFKAPLEDLFWYGQGDNKGLAYLIEQRAPLSDIQASRAALDRELAAAQAALGSTNAPVAVASNAAIIVFREGLEAVLILASLMGSLKQGDQRRYRRPLWWGAAAAFGVTVLTWLLARGVLASLARYGERLEAIVSLIAIAVLLLITNWFFHKVYWTGWMANFHTRKRRIIGGEVGQWLGLATLGFTSIYREGFETVLFLQALVLEAGTPVVLGGVALGLGGTALVGLVVFALQAHLPYKRMLIVTGIMIGGVLLQMVGNTAHVMQVVGWLSIHPIRSLELPYWTGMWFGLYATWEGIGLQVAAAVFVIGSYFLAEHMQRQRPAPARAAQPTRKVA
jgi:high-affinity iron transporter